MSYVYEIDLLH